MVDCAMAIRTYGYRPMRAMSEFAGGTELLFAALFALMRTVPVHLPFATDD